MSIILKSMIMDKISILDTVKPSLEKLKRIQTEETKPLVKELEDKLEKKQEQLQNYINQLRMEIRRLSSL
jgi:hypothetical protein